VTFPRVTPPGLHEAGSSVVDGLHVLERRVSNPAATVICVHGGLDRGGSFARVARRLDRFDVVTYDRRGYQGSRALGPIDLEHHVGDLVQLVTHERRETPVIVLGHSYGGVVAISAALCAPEAINLIVAYEAPLPWIHKRPGYVEHLGTNGAEEAEIFFRRMVSDSSWLRLSDEERAGRRADGVALLDDLSTIRSEPPFDIGELATPLTYSYGDGDRARYAYYHELCALLQKKLPAMRERTLPKALHGAHLANPDQLAKLINQEWTVQCELA
jgi:pimeloyl-ACP methyl ester carboxylesterase